MSNVGVARFSLSFESSLLAWTTETALHPSQCTPLSPCWQQLPCPLQVHAPFTAFWSSAVTVTVSL